ncbi:RNA ligase family protein [Streptomyces xanthophaeus]
MSEFEFKPWPKTARLFRDIVITEKIDGTNAAVHVSDDGRVAAQSRNRLISPDSDNYGFAGWVHANAADLAYILGPGTHFGEWWGRGIQRGYGVEGKRFSLFNTARWYGDQEEPEDNPMNRSMRTELRDVVGVVPVMYAGVFGEDAVYDALLHLKKCGSIAAPGYMNPEGICIYHTQTRGVLKVTLDNHDAGKWEAA